MRNRGQFIIAFFDVLGFESRFKRFGLDGIASRYNTIIDAVRKQNGRVLEVFGGKVEMSESVYWMLDQDIFLYAPTYGAYASDSILLWSDRWFPPAHDLTLEELSEKSSDPARGWQYLPVPSDSFLRACSELICTGIECAMPLRGAVSIGEAIFSVANGIFIGKPLIEAARLEKRQKFIGAGFCKSFADPLIPKRFLLDCDEHLKPGGKELSSGTVLDWPRHWRETRGASAPLFIDTLQSQDFLEYYENTLRLIDASAEAAPSKETDYESSLRKDYPQFRSELLEASTRACALEILPPVDLSELPPAEQIRSYMKKADGCVVDNQWQAAHEALTHALNVAESSEDLYWQIQALANMGVAHLCMGEHETAESTLIRAAQLYNDNFVLPLFEAVEIRRESEVTYKRVKDVSEEESRYVTRTLGIPERLSSLFEVDANDAVGKFQWLAETVGNAARNLGENAFMQEDSEKAEFYFKSALDIDRGMNFAPGVAIDLSRLGYIADRRNERERACDYWRQALSIYEQLAVADHCNWLQWERNAIELRKAIQEYGCPQTESSGTGP